MESVVKGGEEAENAASPAEDKSPASPTTDAPTDTKEEKPADKNEPTSTPAPTPTPEANKEDEKKVEVSHVQAAVVEPTVEVTKSQPITTSIIERKTSEDFPTQLPSSPPPTPIDPSPLQQAAANATALAEALKVPAETIAQSTNQVPVVEAFNQKTDQKDLIVQSEEGPVPVSDLEDKTEPVSDQNDIEPPQPEVIEEIVIEEVNQVDETIPVEEVEVEVIEEPDMLVPVPEPEPVEPEIEVTEETEEIPPPLPDSPIPLPKASADLLNFMSSQISDTPPLSEIIDCAAVPQETEQTDELTAVIPDELPPPEIDDIPPPPQNPELLTPPRSPSPSAIPPPESSLPDSYDGDGKDCNILNSYQDSETNGDRLADSNDEDNECPLTHIKNDQSIEPEAPVEKASEVTTEEEAPKSPPPSVPAEAPAPAAPVITEDVASVTKAIEEIDINEKAVAAAVNENIESATNEIIQNNLNE